ncbi:Probable RNA-directed DNA polymerase from transposon X-element [Eumeta japonica]|uniref:Probable RNA-directed DNA polymerase from transposon X-element n=1 Tax=Eumeta variegata TaxID=151549 RepID=A0A4C1XI58_EUMVA|nr:Probable RNA-directed DNA polymerase from transposon X-element [Eumeta japonica]
MIQETYLKPNRPRACAIAGYVQLRTYRTYARRGGTALYYSRSLHCCPLTILPLINMEATGCRLAMAGHRTIIVVSVYLPSPKPLLRWGCAIMDQNGEKLDRLQDRLEFEIIAPSTATYFPYNDSNRPSTLDIALTKGVALNLNSFETLHSLLSDHRPVLLKMGPPDGGRPISTIKITDWKRVSTAFEKIDPPPLNSIPNDIRTTEEIDHAISALTSHVRTVIEKCERKVPASSDNRKFPPDILELIRAKNAALRRASAYPTPEYRSRARALQREARVQDSEMRVGATSWRKLDRLIKRFGKSPKRLKQRLISIVSRKRFFKTSLEPKDDLTPVSLSEVQTLVKSISTRKAPGLYGVSNKAIKCFSQPLLSLLVAIFNACLQNCYFPSAWKEAEVIGIHKPGKPRDLPASYRPISLLSGLAKLFERVLKTRLSNHLFGKGLIIDKQFGFRPAHSCPQQVLRLVEYVSEGFKTKQKTVAVFFDVAKAFNRVWHADLSRSSARLRPLSLLYSAYTNDIPRPTSGVQLALFADDTALFFRSRTRRSIFRHLPRAIDELGQWFRKWRIEVNPDKSAAIQFKYSKNRSKLVVDWNTPNLKMLNARIPWQRSYKYLGVTLDKNLHFREHIARVRKNALFYTARLGAISRRNKRTLYKMCIRTNKFCRAATDAHWCVRNSILHRDLELPTLPKYMKDASKRFFDIAGSHPNALLRAAVDYQPPPPTHFIRRPRNVLIDPPDALTAAVDSLNDVNDTHD